MLHLPQGKVFLHAVGSDFVVDLSYDGFRDHLLVSALDVVEERGVGVLWSEVSLHEDPAGG